MIAFLSYVPYVAFFLSALGFFVFAALMMAGYIHEYAKSALIFGGAMLAWGLVAKIVAL